MNIRVWAEYLSPDEMLGKGTVNLLKKYNVTLGMAFPPEGMNRDYAKMLAAYGQAGVPVMLWPLLPDESGYWANEMNAMEFSDHIEKIFDWADGAKLQIPWLAVDMETPFYQLERIKNASGFNKLKHIVSAFSENRDRGRFYESSAVYGRLVGRMHARGAKVIAAAAAPVTEDFQRGAFGIQDALETPVSTVNWDIVSFMIYTSAAVGYGKPFVSPRDARWYLYSVMRDMKKLLWNRAGVSIGCTCTGKISDEPFYSTPEELLPDMQAAKASLIDDVAIYNLEGILRSRRPEAWFETLMSCDAVVPERSHKADAARLALQAASMFI